MTQEEKLTRAFCVSLFITTLITIITVGFLAVIGKLPPSEKKTNPHAGRAGFPH